MRVLFIGEGSHDIGPPTFDPQPRPATGTVPTLTRRVCPEVDDGSLALSWREIPILDKRQARKGLAAKVERAIVLSAEKFGLAGTVCVTDQDRDERRLAGMEEGQVRGLKSVRESHAAVCGVAVESIEAWTLGAPKAIADVLDIKTEDVQSQYKLRNVESFYQRSGKREHRPKDILSRVLDQEDETDSASLRTTVAERTDGESLERNCPIGFKPFSEKLKAAFSAR